MKHGLDSDGEVILRALALLDEADAVVGSDGVLTIQAADGEPVGDRSREVRVWRTDEMSGAATG